MRLTKAHADEWNIDEFTGNNFIACLTGVFRKMLSSKPHTHPSKHLGLLQSWDEEPEVKTTKNRIFRPERHTPVAKFVPTARHRRT